MSVAILSIPLGIISIIGFVWSFNVMSEDPKAARDKNKKKDNDSALIGIIVSTILFFVALGIYDGKESTAGLFASENAAQEQSAQDSSSKTSSKKSQAELEVEEANKEKMEKAQSRSNDEDENSQAKGQSDSIASNEFNDTTKLEDASHNKDLEKQQKAYKEWRNQMDSKIKSIDLTWATLWKDSEPDSLEKLMKVLDSTKDQIKEIKIPDELSAAHRQRLTKSTARYVEWIESRYQACKMVSDGKDRDAEDVFSTVSKGDGLKLQSNVDVSNISRELELDGY